MERFKTLFMMQLKEKLDLSFLKSKKQILFKVAFSILGFVAVTALAYLVLWFCQFLNLFSALNHLPLSLMAVVFFVMFALSLFTCTVGLSKALFYAKDNQVLITFPVTPNALFLSKMLVYYINEIKKTFTFLIPVFLAYGILSNLPIYYFPWMIVMLVIFTAIPVLLGGLLAIPTNYVIGFLKRFPIIKIALLALVLAGVVVGVVFLINKIPANINLIRSWVTVSQFIREFLNWFSTAFYPFYAFVIFLCGKFQNLTVTFFTTYSYAVFLVILGAILVLIGLNFLISRPLYLKIASKQFEFDKTPVKRAKENVKMHSFLSTCVYEAKRNFRDISVLSTSLSTLIIAPIAILFLNKIYAAISTRLMGDYFTISFNILIILLFVLSHNINVASIYSRDGEALYLNKMKPQKPLSILLPRLFYNFAFSFVILTISSVIFFAHSPIGAGDAICAFLIMLFVTCTHIIWCADIDFLHPKWNIYKTEGAAGVNPNEVKATILTFALGLATFGITVFLLIDGMNFVWLKLLAISAFLFGLRMFLFASKAKVLFKEK